MKVLMYENKNCSWLDRLVLWDGENTYWSDEMIPSVGYRYLTLSKWCPITHGRFVLIGDL